jgi:hypothetical protein
MSLAVETRREQERLVASTHHAGELDRRRQFLQWSGGSNTQMRSGLLGISRERSEGFPTVESLAQMQ